MIELRKRKTDRVDNEPTRAGHGGRLDPFENKNIIFTNKYINIWNKYRTNVDKLVKT